jgi:hypothetical protein
MDLEYGAKAKRVTIDGEIDIENIIQASILLNLELEPEPAFDFDFALQFTPLLSFTAHAKSKGDIKDFHDLSHIDFDLVATFEQHLLDYIRDQALDQIEHAKKASSGAINAAKGGVSKATDELKLDIDRKQSALDAAKKSWDDKSQQVHAAQTAIVDRYNAQAAALRARVENEHAKFNVAVKDAETKLQQFNANRTTKLQQAQGVVNEIKAKWDRDTANAEAKLHNAQTTFNLKFGKVENDLTNATNRVNSLQNQINEIENKINDYKHARGYELQ